MGGGIFLAFLGYFHNVTLLGRGQEVQGFGGNLSAYGIHLNGILHCSTSRCE
jgi:hypothetical protein